MFLFAKGFVACLERWLQSEILVVFILGVVELDLDLGGLLPKSACGDRQNCTHLFVFVCFFKGDCDSVWFLLGLFILSHPKGLMFQKVGGPSPLMMGPIVLSLVKQPLSPISSGNKAFV